MYTRYCTNCGEEFRPEILRCSDCGGELEDRYEDEGETGPAGEAEATVSDVQAPADEYHPVFACRDSSTLKEAADRLAAAGVPFRATGSAAGFQLLVRSQDGPAAVETLGGREETVGVGDDAQPSVGVEGGVCPACGTSVPAGVRECPGCALVVGAEPARCASCGSLLGPADVQCPVCRAPEG